jgi:signal transduction histidine kinase
MNDSKGRSRFTLLALISSLALQALAWFQLMLFYPFPAPFPNFRAVTAFLIALSAACAVAMYAVRSRMRFYAALALSYACFLALGFGLGDRLSVEQTLLAAIAVQCGIYERYPANLVVGAALIAGGCLVQGPSSMIGNELIVFLLYPSLLLGAVGLLTRYREQTVRCASDLARMDAAVMDLARAQTGYMQLANTATERSKIEERNRITRELHDTLGYSLTNVVMILEASKDLARDGPRELLDLLQTGREQVESCLDGTRRALHVLRAQETASPSGFSALQGLVSTFRKATGISVEVSYGNSPPSLDPAQEEAVYHFVQEGMTNSFRHGRASRIRIVFWCDAETLRVSVWDDGPGADGIVEGIGMRGMRERIGMLGGTFDARNAVDGFEIVAELPLRT